MPPFLNSGALESDQIGQEVIRARCRIYLAFHSMIVPNHYTQYNKLQVCGTDICSVLSKSYKRSSIKRAWPVPNKIREAL